MKSWVNFRLSEIYYEKSELDKLRAIYEEFSSLGIPGFGDVFTTIYSFHKNLIYNYEKEIRLLYVNDNHNSRLNEIVSPYFKNGKNASFVELDLEFKENQISKASLEPEERKSKMLKLKDYKPNVKIKKIILGYRLGKSKHEISNVICDYIENFQNKSVAIENSTLQQYFND